jgi:hypothetical protein
VEILGSGDADVIGFARDGDDAVAVLLRVRDGKVVGREHRFLENVEGEEDAAILNAFLVRYYMPAEARALRVVLPFPPAELDLLAELEPGTDWALPQRGIMHRWMLLAEQNARHLLESLRIESFETEERAEDPVYGAGARPGAATGAAEPRLRRHLPQRRARHGGVTGVVRGRAPAQGRVSQVPDRRAGTAGRLRRHP